MEEHINESFHAVVDDIRTRSSEELLDENLTEVWLKKGYSRESVLEYIDSLLGDFKYQKAALSATIRDLSEQKKTLALEKEVLSKQLAESRSQENAYKVEAEDRLSNLKSKIFELKEENQSLRARIDESKQIGSQLTSQNKELMSSENNLQQEIVKLKKTNKDLEDELAKLEDQTANEVSFGSENARLEDELMRLTKDYNSCSADRDDLIEQLEIASRQIEELVNSTGDTAAILNRARSVQADVFALQEKLGIESARTDEKGKNKSYPNQGRDEKLVQLLDGSVAALESLLQATHHIEEEKNELEIEVAKSVAEASRAKSTIIMLDGELGECKEELSEAKQALEDINQEYKQVSTDLEKTKEYNRSLKVGYENSRLKIDSQNKAFELIQRVVTSMTQTSQALSLEDIMGEGQADLSSVMNPDITTSAKTLISQINAEIDDSEE